MNSPASPGLRQRERHCGHNNDGPNGCLGCDGRPSRGSDAVTPTIVCPDDCDARPTSATSNGVGTTTATLSLASGGRQLTWPSATTGAQAEQIGQAGWAQAQAPAQAPAGARGPEGSQSGRDAAIPVCPGARGAADAQTCHSGPGGAADNDTAGPGPESESEPRASSRASSVRRQQGKLLNAVEALLGDAIWDAFPLYLRAIGIDVRMGRSVEDTRRLMGRHLGDNGIPLPRDAPWEIIASKLGGRGVVATRDLQPDDLVLVDAPLVLGPRAGSDPATPVVCVGCMQPRDPLDLRACPRGCRLPVCSETCRRPCEDAPCHVSECALLRRWGVTGDPAQWSDALVRASAAVRCLALPPEKREILASMQSHHGRQHAFEVGLLLECLRNRPTPEEERFMRLACCVMDANAFRMTLPFQPAQPQSKTEKWHPLVGALRGLYPLGALLNHECTPNTRHSYDEHGNMVIRVARPVARGEELTVTYSALLWGSPARRQHLLRTKHFLCACARCKDPAESGTFLAALPCPSRPCGGPVLPASPLSLTGPWRCSGCGLDVPAERATLLQSVLGGLLRTLHLDPALPPAPDTVMCFLEDNRRLLPANNHVTVELKADVVWALGRRPGLAFDELSEEQLQLKERLIRELLAVLRALQAGRCSLSGMLLYELHCTLMERCRRDPDEWSAVAVEALDAVEVANGILAEDNAGPSDLADLLRRARLMPRDVPPASASALTVVSSHGANEGGPPGPPPQEPIACL